jgi:hypothetical protein
MFEDGEFKRIEVDDPKECHLIEQIMNGIRLTKKDYEILKECKSFVEKLTWDGITEKFVKGVGSIVNYIFLASDKRVEIEEIIAALDGIEEKDIKEPGTRGESVDIKKQFQEEMANYSLFEHIRRQLIVGDS